MDEGPGPSAWTSCGRQVKEACGIAEQEHKIEIRPAQVKDIEGLLVIEQRCFNVYYYAFYTFDRKDFEFYLDDPDTVFLAAVLDNRLVGYVLGPVETWRAPPAAHIDSIAVLPEMQHQSIGSRLIKSYMREVRRLGCEFVTLEVSPANEVGLAFFARCGFGRVHRLRNYYGKGLHGLLMAAPCDRPKSNE
jgi:[ribosomal protein S18]-alanine N-acetyltransferase